MLSDLKDKNGNVIEGKNVKLYELDHVATLPTWHKDQLNRWYPELLRTMTDKLPIKAGMVNAVWVDAKAPASTPAGEYSGIITLSRKGVERVCNITYTVNNIIIPERPSLYTAFWLFPNKVRDAVTEENPVPTFGGLLKDYVDLSLEHKMTPVSSGMQVSVEKQEDGSYKVDEKYIKYFQYYYTYVMENGGNAIAINTDCFFGIRSTAGFKGETKEDKVQVKDGVIPPHRKKIIEDYIRQTYGFAQAKGWEKYCYNQLLDEVKDENFSLMAFRSEFEGYLFWSLNYYIGTDRFRHPAGIVAHFGDGLMIYDEGEGKDLLVSLRMKIYRAGMEDYEYLLKLKELHNSDKLSKAEKKEVAEAMNLDQLLYYDAWENQDLVIENRKKMGKINDKYSK